MKPVTDFAKLMTQAAQRAGLEAKALAAMVNAGAIGIEPPQRGHRTRAARLRSLRRRGPDRGDPQA